MRTLTTIATISLTILIAACKGSSTGTEFNPGFNTGLYPDFAGLSVAIDTLNPEALYIDGAEINISASVADRNGNNIVLDGTQVSFKTEYGVLETPSCTIENGTCSVRWRSQGARPADGRISVLAWTTGTESFTDINSNGFFDDGDIFNTATNDLSEPFLDSNENEVRDSDEPYIDYDGDSTFDAADGLYSGPDCAHSTLCAPSQFLYIFNSPFDGATPADDISQTIFVASGQQITAFLENGVTAPINIGTTPTFFLLIGDENSNALPKDTTLSISSTLGTATITPTAFPNSTQQQWFTIAIDKGTAVAPSNGSVTIIATTPSNVVSTVSVNTTL